MRRLLIIGIGLAPVIAPFTACSGENGSSDAPDADAGAADARVDRSVGDSALADVAPDRAPTYNTDGWIGIPFDPDVDCGFFAAPTPEKMPPPIQWEDCDPAMAAGRSCRQIVTNWTPPDPSLSNHPMAPALAGWTDESGHAWLVVNRFSGTHAFYLVAEADGPLHMAFLRPSGDCYVNDASLTARRVIFNASRQNKSTIYRWGAIGGDVDKVPLVLESYGDGIGRAYAAGPNAYFAELANALKTWTSPSAVVALVSNSSAGEPGEPSFVGDTMFFPFGNLAYHRIRMHSPDGGTQDFISYGDDVSKGADDFGTDGINMVWTEAFGRSAPGKPWTTIDILTAPFTTDPAAIQKRRLRSEANSIGSGHFTVGCGYGAHFFSSTTEGTGTRLVRLSDGRSWRFTAVTNDGPRWVFNGPLAVTCDEVFVGFYRGDQFNVARIRLDSLGPGDPPD